MEKKEDLIQQAQEIDVDVSIKDTKREIQEKIASDIVAREGEESNRAFVLFDKADDDNIVRELTGEVLDKFVYVFEDKRGKTVSGLSKAGVDQVCRESANIKKEAYRIIGDPIILDEGDAIRVIIKAGRYKLHIDKNGNIIGESLIDTAIGAKRQKKTMKAKIKGQVVTVEDPFYFEKAISKAQRNAKMNLLPYKIITEFITKYIENGKIQKIKAGDVISEEKRRWLHATAERYGISHAQLKAIIKRYGFESTNEITEDMVDKIVEDIIPKQLPEGIPDEVKAKAKEYNINEAKLKALWDKYSSYYKDIDNRVKAVKVAIEKMGGKQ